MISSKKNRPEWLIFYIHIWHMCFKFKMNDLPEIQLVGETPYVALEYHIYFSSELYLSLLWHGGFFSLFFEGEYLGTNSENTLSPGNN